MGEDMAGLGRDCGGVHSVKLKKSTKMLCGGGKFHFLCLGHQRYLFYFTSNLESQRVSLSKDWKGKQPQRLKKNSFSPFNSPLSDHADTNLRKSLGSFVIT